MASAIYACCGARNHRSMHSIRLIQNYRNRDGNSWGSQEATPETEAPLAVAKQSHRCRASRYMSEVMNVCHTPALNERVPPSQARSVSALHHLNRPQGIWRLRTHQGDSDHPMTRSAALIARLR